MGRNISAPIPEHESREDRGYWESDSGAKSTETTPEWFGLGKGP